MLNITLSIIGILVSGLGLWYAIRQVKGLKKITEEYKQQVHQEVMSAQDKIRDGLNISEVTMCIKNLESAIIYVRDGKIDLALLRMEDIETILHNNIAMLHIKEQVRQKSITKPLENSIC